MSLKTHYYYLNQGKERRKQLDESREFIVTAKNEKAFQRAKESLQSKQDKLRSMFSKVTKVKERRSILEQERRKHVMASMKSRLSSATTRADNLVQKRQGRVHYNKRRTQAIERRKQVDDSREIILNVRYEKALLRAKESLQLKQDKLRSMFSKGTIVKERRTMLEQKRRKRVLSSMESRLNSALTRAEHLVQMKQGRARYDKRRKRVREKRVSLEFERRTHLLFTIDNRAERATRNLKMRLRDRQYKARENIEHAVCVSRRVKAARLLQKVIRNKLGLGGDSSFEVQDVPQFYQHAAAIRLQNIWRIHMVVKRINSGDKLQSPMKSLALMLANMGLSSAEKLPAGQRFDELSSIIAQTSILKSAHTFLDAFHPLLQRNSSRMVKSCILSNRILLSAFLIMHNPDEVLGGKRSTDLCSKLLEKASSTLCSQLFNLLACSEGPSSKLMHATVKGLVASFISYSTLFNVWKDADFNELVSHMLISAEQSWVVYLTSKKTISYGDERIRMLSEEHDDGVLFQNRLHHESAKRGAFKLIKRIRTSFSKLVDKEEALQLVKDAKQSAIQKIETENMMVPLKAEVDNKLLASSKSQSLEGAESSKMEKIHLDHDEKHDINPTTEDIPKHLFSNADLVHKILLTGSDNVKDLLIQSPNGYRADIFDSSKTFMTFWHQRHVVLSNTDHEMLNAASLEEVTAMTMECAYFDKVEHELTVNQSLKGVHDLVLNLCHKMQQLVPNRTDLHSVISDDDVMNCKLMIDVLKLLIKMSYIMSNDLEAPYRSPSTMEWQQHTEAYIQSKIEMDRDIPYAFEKPEAFLVASISFLLKKIELCHIDKMNFELMKVVPLICQIGGEYEKKNFQIKYGMFGSMSSMKELSATWGWMQRSREALVMSPSMIIDTVRIDCFIDELLFVKDAIPMPEVLSLDGDLIKKVRRCAQTTVIGSAIFLHACNIAEVSTYQTDSLTSQAQYHRNRFVSLLNRMPSHDSLSDALTKFIGAIKRVEIEPEKKASLRRLVEKVCDGNDAVLKLLDSRMRQLFKFACALDFSVENIPIAMRTGISNASKTGMNDEECSIKVHIMTQCESEAKKLGFGMFSNDLVKAAYDASKAINHSLYLYRETVFMPIMEEMISLNEEE